MRSAMHAASQLPRRGPTDVDDAPAPACQSEIRLTYGPGHEKTCLQGFQQSEIQTSLLSHRD